MSEILYPVTPEQTIIVTNQNNTLYIPAATTERLGSVIIGGGLIVDETGLVSVDPDTYYTEDEVDAALALKADAADVYNKTESDNLLASKADKATTYTETEVDNLLDGKIDKTLSKITSVPQYAVVLQGNGNPKYTNLVSTGSQQMYPNDNPKVAMFDTHGNLGSTTLPTETYHYTNKEYVDSRTGVSGFVFDTILTMVDKLKTELYEAGTNLFVIDLDVPDFWITVKSGTFVDYTYITDQALIDVVKISPVQIGYYFISMLETQKVDLTNYYTQTETNGLLDDKADKNRIQNSDNSSYFEAGGNVVNVSNGEIYRTLLTQSPTSINLRRSSIASGNGYIDFNIGNNGRIEINVSSTSDLESQTYILNNVVDSLDNVARMKELRDALQNISIIMEIGEGF